MQKTIQGAGLAFRIPHLTPLLLMKSSDYPFQWIELLGDNFLCPHLPLLEKIDELRKDVPFVLHLTGLSLAGDEPLNERYLKQVDLLVERYDPTLISDHLCWSISGNHYLHDLLPFPFTHRALKNISNKIKQLQDRWQRDFLIENISSYLTIENSKQDFSEVDFINALIHQTDCKLLLDINNVYVSCINHGQQATDFLTHIETNAIRQIHLAGFSKQAHLLIDTHSRVVHEEVWGLFLSFIKKIRKIPTVLEWDHDLPPLPFLLEETRKISVLLESNP